MRVIAFVLGLLVAVPALSDGVGGCNYNLQNYSDRGSVLIYRRGGSLSMQTVLDGDVNVFPKLKASSATGEQTRDEAKSNTRFNKEMADAHIFPADIRRLDVYLADPATPSSASSSSATPAASYYAFYGDRNVFLGGFGTIGADWYACDWQ